MNLPKPKADSRRGDLIAGLTTGIANIPDAMASAILAGANPISGLYAIMVGTPIGALFSSSAVMCIAATSATAITAGQALEPFAGPDHDRYLFTLTLLVGLILVGAGLLRLGKLVRFVSNSVMVGFLTGISVLVILSQIGDFTGYDSAYSNKVAQALDTLLHLGQINLHTTLIGLVTVAVILFADRTRLRNFSLLIGMLAGAFALFVLGWGDVQTVSDVAVIPKGFPLPVLPQLSYLPVLIFDALAIAILAMVQGAGLSNSFPNPDGNYPDVSRDFIGQGAANVAAGFFQGIPVGGSVGSTALNVSAGAKTRLSNIVSGLVVIVVVLLFGTAVGRVPMSAMAGLLIVAGYQSIKQDAFMDVWQTAAAPRFVMLVTLFFTLMIPLQWAVFVGVLLSILAHLVISASETRITQIIPSPDGTYLETPPPAELPSATITMINFSGDLFFGAANQLEDKLPSPRNSRHAVVILRLRPYASVSSTFIKALERYARQVQQGGGRLMLAGVSPGVKDQLERTETTGDTLGEENLFVATTTIGAASRAAYAEAQRWLAEAQS